MFQSVYIPVAGQCAPFFLAARKPSTALGMNLSNPLEPDGYTVLLNMYNKSCT